MKDIIERLTRLEQVFVAESCEEPVFEEDTHRIHFSLAHLQEHALVCEAARAEIERLSGVLEVSEACNKAKTEAILGAQVALARDEDIPGAMKCLLNTAGKTTA